MLLPKKTPLQRHESVDEINHNHLQLPMPHVSVRRVFPEQ